MGRILRDARVAFRLRAGGNDAQHDRTAIAITSLALGIGANTLMFSFVNAGLLRPLPFPGADRLVAITMAPADNPGMRGLLPPPMFFLLRDHSRSFVAVGAYDGFARSVNLTDDASHSIAERLTQGRAHWLRAIGRLKPGVSLEQAAPETHSLAAAYERLFPDRGKGWTLALQPMDEAFFDDMRQPLTLLQTAVGLAGR